MNLTENHILIGLGGTGGKVLKAFRKRIFQEYNPEERAKLPISYVYVDSTREMMQPGDITWRVLGEDACFNENEFVFIKGVEVEAILRNPSGYPGSKGFIGDPEVMGKCLGSVGAAAGQKRRAGRILFGSSVKTYQSALLQQFSKANSISGGVRTNIHIFTGLAGGTGSGSIIDVIAQTRTIPQFQKEVEEGSNSGTNIVVYCMIPEVTPPQGCDAGRYHANGYAALTELNALFVKKYIPHDVTGQSERLNLQAIRKVADGCIVYSNINEKGKIFESLKQLPILVSDFAYSRIFLEGNENTNDFLRSYSFENITGHDKENNEKAKEGQIDYSRSKTYSTFGIKRIIIPEEEIIDYFTYSFGRQALLQMRFNSWNDDLGYRDKPAQIDFHSFVKEDEQLERWHISNKHLILDKPILKSDEKKWNGITDYWSSIIPLWTAQISGNKMPLNDLESLCAEGYNKLFRKGGVDDFYDGKKQAKEAHANEICGLIEDYIFDQWSVGNLSLFNLLELMGCLREFIDSKRIEQEGKLSTYNQSIEQLEKAKALNQLDWANKGFIGGLISKNKLIQAHATIMQQLCIKKTEARGIDFSISLLTMLQNKLGSLEGRIERFVSIISEALDSTEKQIASRCQDEGGIADLKESIIRFYDKAAVVRFTQTVIQDKTRQKTISDEFRQQVIALIGNDHTFARANANVTTDDISKLLDTVIRAKAITIHDNILIEDNEKLINRNILEQLSERYHNEDDLRAFAKTVIEQSSVLLTFNHSEMERAVKNNPIPDTININRRIIFINLPNPAGNEQVLKFAGRLKMALTNAASSGLNIKVDMNGTHKNEISVSAMTYCFPLRTIESLKFLKERYEQMLNNPNEARQNRTVLHTEGTGENFPSLFVADDKLPNEIREMFTSYLIAAYVIDVVKYADKMDGSGKKAFGTVEKNRLGLEILTPLADRFTDICFTDKFTEEFGEQLRERLQNALKTEYLHEGKRSELITRIQQLIGTIILPECGNAQGSEQFLFFARHAERAMDLIEKA